MFKLILNLKNGKRMYAGIYDSENAAWDAIFFNLNLYNIASAEVEAI